MIERVASACYAVKIAVSQQGITDASSLCNIQRKISVKINPLSNFYCDCHAYAGIISPLIGITLV